MDEPTTTVEPVQPTPGADVAQPVEPVEKTAEPVAPAVPSEPQPGGDDDGDTPDQPVPAIDDKLKTYAKSQGIDNVDELTERELKLLKTASTNQAQATKNYQRTTELEKASAVTPDQIPADATPAQTENIRIRSLELKYEASQWKQANPEKAAFEPQMVKLLTDDPNMKAMVQEGYLTYDNLYAMAKGSSDDSASVKAQGAKAALTSLAHTQQAAVPKGNATNPGTTPTGKKFEDLSLAEMEKKLGSVRY